MRLLSKITIVVCVAVLASAVGISVKADNTSPQSSEYAFHLYFNTQNQLVVDKTAKFSYDIISAPFIQPSVGQFPYRGEVINFMGAVSANFKFNIQSGAITVNAPYAADGQKAIFYDNQNQPVLTISVSGSSFCNDDGICNADRGEDSQTCPKDCSQSLPVPVVTTTPPTTTSGNASSTLLSSILWLLGGLILAGLGWWFFKRTHHGPTSLPPQLPPTQPLPTPPTPPSTNNSV